MFIGFVHSVETSTALTTQSTMILDSAGFKEISGVNFNERYPSNIKQKCWRRIAVCFVSTFSDISYTSNVKRPTKIIIRDHHKKKKKSCSRCGALYKTISVND